jgi:uncharacterized protein YeaO (DUF488 family)
MEMNIERTYDPTQQGDGVRILVDRLWPRGLKKEDAKIDAGWSYDTLVSFAVEGRSRFRAGRPCFAWENK